MGRNVAALVVGVTVTTASWAAGQDQVVLTYSPTTVLTSSPAAIGGAVTIHLVALLEDPREEIVGFSCQAASDPLALENLTWLPPATTGPDGSVTATFQPPLAATAGSVVLATATAEVVGFGEGAVRLVKAPVLTTRSGLEREVPFVDPAGQRLDVTAPAAPDLGPPGAPGKPELH
jgi:hypothetical protein